MLPFFLPNPFPISCSHRIQTCPSSQTWRFLRNPSQNVANYWNVCNPDSVRETTRHTLNQTSVKKNPPAWNLSALSANLYHHTNSPAVYSWSTSTLILCSLPEIFGEQIDVIMYLPSHTTFLFFETHLTRNRNTAKTRVHRLQFSRAISQNHPFHGGIQSMAFTYWLATSTSSALRVILGSLLRTFPASI